MASYHFESKIIGRSGGKSAVGAAAYRSGGIMTCPETGEVFDYRKKTGIVDAFIMAPETAPEWTRDRQALWSAVQAKETRKNSQLSREFTLALPHELSAAEGTELVRSFVETELVSLGMVADVAIHNPHRRPAKPMEHVVLPADDQDGDDPDNLHAHIMLTMRQLDATRADGWATNKARDWNETAQLERWRESWADAQNAAFQARGLSVRVDHRSLEAQRAAAEAAGDVIGALVLSRPPEPRLGLAAGGMEAKGITTDRGDALREARADRARLEAMAAEARAAEAGVEAAEIEVEVSDSMASIMTMEIPPLKAPEDDMRDLTKTAIERQLRGMGLPEIEVTIAGDKRSVLTMTPSQILEDLPRLKRSNKLGSAIYIRGPRDRDHDLILVDDIQAFTPARMEADGLKPAVVVETSPGNFQAWVRLGEPVPADVRREAAMILAERYGGDTAAADAHQSGRLAGFTNGKPEHRTAKGSPFVLLSSFAGKVASAARDLIDAAKSALAKRIEVTEAAQIDVTPSPIANPDLVRWWRAEQATAPAGKSLSEVDWHLTHLALGSGHSPEDVAAALEVVSERKGKHAMSYAIQTVEKAAGTRYMPAPEDDGPSL